MPFNNINLCFFSCSEYSLGFQTSKLSLKQTNRSCDIRALYRLTFESIQKTLLLFSFPDGQNVKEQKKEDEEEAEKAG